MVNKVTDYVWNKKSRLGYIEVNGARLLLFRERMSYDEKNLRYRMGYAVQTTNDFNRSGRFVMLSRTIKSLVNKIERHPHKLIRPY